jgi:predicted DNA-binding transcriptional regulator AlpA
MPMALRQRNQEHAGRTLDERGTSVKMEAAKNKERLVVQLTVEELSEIVREAIISALKAGPREDKLLKAEEVCKILNVSEEWIYHHAQKLPFVRKVGGMLRFSNNGLQRYIESTKFTVKGT